MKTFKDFMQNNLSEAEDNSVQVQVLKEVYHVTKKGKNGTFFEEHWVSQLEISINKNTARFISDFIHRDLSSLNTDSSTLEDEAKFFLPEINATLKKNGYPVVKASEVEVTWISSDAALLKHKKK